MNLESFAPMIYPWGKKIFLDEIQQQIMNGELEVACASYEFPVLGNGCCCLDIRLCQIL